MILNHISLDNQGTELTTTKKEQIHTIYVMTEGAPCRHIYLLSDLDHSFPVVLGFDAVAVVTHLVLHHKLHNKHLLQDGAVQHLQRHR